jgi:hypothetical protein
MEIHILAWKLANPSNLRRVISPLEKPQRQVSQQDQLTLNQQDNNGWIARALYDHIQFITHIYIYTCTWRRRNLIHVRLTLETFFDLK